MARPQSEAMTAVQKAVTAKRKPMTIKEACALHGVKENSVYKSAWYAEWKKASHA